MMLRVMKIKIGWNGICAFALIALAVLLRVVLIALGWPQHMSDESIMGLMALHINNRGELPIFFYGQFYMGATEAYLSAGLFHLFGASVITLRLVPLLLFALFLSCMYLLTSLLYSKQLALVTLALLGLGSNIVLQTEIVAIGGYPEMLAFGALAFLLASWLALSNEQFVSGHRRWRFSLGYALWGLVIGLGIWSDYIFVVIMLVSGLLLLVSSWRTLLSWRVLPFLLLGLMIGMFPLIIYNTSHPVLNSWGVLQSLRNNYSTILSIPHSFDHFPFGGSIAGTLLVSLPSITGAPPLCYDPNLILYGVPSLTLFSCINAQYGIVQELLTLSWSLALLVLWAVAVLQTLGSLYRLWRLAPQRTRPPEQTQAIIRHVARLVLLFSAAIFLTQFGLSPIAAVFPTNARYLTGLLVSTPAVLAPLWGLWRESQTPASVAENKNGRLPQVNTTLLRLVLGRAILLLAGLVLLWGSISVFRDIPTVQASRQQEDALMRDLLHINVTHVYTDYWTCYRLAFDSKEAITCVVINQFLHHDHDRYPTYDAAVQSDPHVAYVFPPSAAQIPAIEQMAASTGKHIQRVSFDGYVILQLV
jgi:cytochrome b subunit of formate dehydrogenase